MRESQEYGSGLQENSGLSAPERCVLPAAIRRELKPGEIVRWCERESQDRRADVVILVLMGAVGGLLCAIFPEVWGSRGFAVLLLMGIVIACFAAVRRLRRVTQQRAETMYVVTDRRAIVYGWMHPHQLKAHLWSFYPKDVAQRIVTVRARGRGEIIFWEMSWPRCEDREVRRVGFLSVSDVQRVDALLQKMVEGVSLNIPRGDSADLERDAAILASLGVYGGIPSGAKRARRKSQAQLPSPSVLVVAWILSLVLFVDGVCAVGPEVVFWWHMRGAIPMHGTVLKLKMSPPDPSDFGINVEYGYEVNGRSYVGSRVAIHAHREYGVDTIQRRLWAQLQEAESRKAHITVYVNPDEPSMSALDLTLRWSNLSLILASLFPTILTTGITLWCLLHRRRGSGALTRECVGAGK